MICAKRQGLPWTAQAFRQLSRFHPAIRLRPGTSGRIFATENDVEHKCLPSHEIAIKVAISLARQS